MEKTNSKKKRLHFLYYLLLFALAINPAHLKSQEVRFDISMKNTSLQNILMEIKKKSGKNIVFNNNQIEKYNNETIELKNVKLEEALEKALEKKPFLYKLIDNVIVIEPVNEKQNTSKPSTLNQILKGNIMDATTNTPLVGATVVIFNPTHPLGTTTDVDGNYKITGVPIGRQTVMVSYVGYKKKQFDNIMILSAKENVLNAELEETIEKLDEIKVVAYSKNDPINDMATVSARAFTIEETERFAGSWGDPARMATNYAGVFTAGDQRNDIIIRGNSPTGLLWQLEDIPIPSPNHYDVLGTTGGTISMLNNNLLSRSDFFTSAFPSQYGNATSGVFDLKLRNGNSENREYLAQLGFNGFEAGAEGPISREHKSSYIVNMRYSMLGLVQDLLWVDGLPQYKDASFKVNFPLKSGKISLFGLGGTSSISISEDDDKRSTESQEYTLKSLNGSTTGIVGLNHLYIINSNTTLKSAFAISTRGPEEIVDSLLNDKSYLQLDNNSFKQNEISFSSKLTKRINVKNSVQIGVLVQNMSFEANRMTSDDDDYKIVIDRPYSISNSNLILAQAYLQWKHNVTDNLFFNAGANTMFFQFNEKSSIDPRAGFSWQFSDKQNIGFGYGLHSQIQPINVYFIQSKTGLDQEGRQVYADLGTNKNLDFTRSHQFALSHNYSFNSNLRLKTEAYYQYLYNVPVKKSKGYFSMINSGAAMSVPEEDSLINEGYGKNYGIEFTLEKFLSNNYYFLITSSIFNSKYQGADKKWRNTTYNGQFVINALGGYEYEIKENIILNTNIRAIYAGGKRITPYDLERSKAQNSTFYLYDQAFEKQVKNYFRLDIRIGVLIHRKKATHELALDIVNATNHKNIYRERYDNVAQKPKINYQQGIFPMGLYRINF